MGFPGGTSGKELACQCRKHKRCRFDPWVGKIPWRRQWQPTPLLLLGKSHGQRSLMGYSPWRCRESDMTEVTEHAHKAPLVGRKASSGAILSRNEWKNTVAMEDSFKQ